MRCAVGRRSVPCARVPAFLVGTVLGSGMGGIKAIAADSKLGTDTTVVDTANQTNYDNVTNQGGNVYAAEQNAQAFDPGRTEETVRIQNEARTKNGNRSGVQTVVGETNDRAPETRPTERLISEPTLFSQNDYCTPKAGSSLDIAQRTFKSQYGLACYIIKQTAWDRKSPAFISNGVVYVSEKVDKATLSTLVPHEATHAMGQLGFAPYTEFLVRTPDTINFYSEAGQRLLIMTAEHCGVDSFSMDDAQRVKVYGELNAIVYGLQQSEILTNSQYNYQFVPEAFYDFDGYIKELDSIHEQYKEKVQSDAANFLPQEGSGKVGASDTGTTATDTQQLLELAVANMDTRPVNPRVYNELNAYSRQLQHLNTTQMLLDQKKSILQQQQASGAPLSQIQQTQTDIAKLEKMLTTQQQKLQKAQQSPALQKVIAQHRTSTNDTDPDSSVMEYIGKSVGAKAKNYEVYNPVTGGKMPLTEGTYLKQPKDHVIAGKGRNRQIDHLDFLVETYGGNPLEWTKEKGVGYVDDKYGESHYVEIHWCQEPTVGKVRMKIKVQPDGRIYLEEE